MQSYEYTQSIDSFPRLDGRKMINMKLYIFCQNCVIVLSINWRFVCLILEGPICRPLDVPFNSVSQFYSRDSQRNWKHWK